MWVKEMKYNLKMTEVLQFMIDIVQKRMLVLGASGPALIMNQQIRSVWEESCQPMISPAHREKQCDHVQSHQTDTENDITN